MICLVFTAPRPGGGGVVLPYMGGAKVAGVFAAFWSETWYNFRFDHF